MLGAQQFNEAAGDPAESIYGATTTDTDWKFLKLVDQIAYIDRSDYFISETG